jgi:hypothetical protein
MLVVAEGQRPHPRHPYGPGVSLEDASDRDAVREHVIAITGGATPKAPAHGLAVQELSFVAQTRREGRFVSASLHNY